MRAYYLYTAPIIETQTKSLQKNFHSFVPQLFQVIHGVTIQPA
jgi:hypothetical protein